MTGEEG